MCGSHQYVDYWGGLPTDPLSSANETALSTHSNDCHMYGAILQLKGQIRAFGHRVGMVRVSGVWRGFVAYSGKYGKGRLGKKNCSKDDWGKGRENAGGYSVYGYGGNKDNTCFCIATCKVE